MKQMCRTFFIFLFIVMAGVSVSAQAPAPEGEDSSRSGSTVVGEPVQTEEQADKAAAKESGAGQEDIKKSGTEAKTSTSVSEGPDLKAEKGPSAKTHEETGEVTKEPASSQTEEISGGDKNKVPEKKKTVTPEPTEVSRETTVPQETSKSSSGLIKHLMHADSSAYRYDRIPGYVAGKPAAVFFKDDLVRIEEKTDKDSEGFKQQNKGQGLFGLSHGTTEVIVKGSIVLLIFIVFVLYRSRNKRARSRVFRSYRR